MVAEHYGLWKRMPMGDWPYSYMTMNKNRFNLVDSVLDISSVHDL